MKKALVHDWYYIDGGGEKVVKSFNSIWNDFDHFALVDFLNDQDRENILGGKRASTSFIQNLPTAKKGHQKFLQWFPLAIEQFDLSDYDLILSSSASVAKGVLTNHNQLHICYCHSPIRYAWDLYHQYLNETGLNKGLKGAYAKYVLHKIRSWDVINSNRVDFFIANSHYIAQRIKKIYRRDSTVIYPPVDTLSFTLKEQKENYYFTASRMVPYKKMEIIIKAFNAMPGKRLVVAGHGPEYTRLNKIAHKNVELLGYVSKEVVKEHLQNAKAFVYAAEEDFGIVPVEAQACGTPVICYAKGGLLETVINNETGVYFYEQTEKAVQEAVNEMEKSTFDPKLIRNNALKFSTQRFEKEIKEFVQEKYSNFKKQL